MLPLPVFVFFNLVMQSGQVFTLTDTSAQNKDNDKEGCWNNYMTPDLPKIGVSGVE